jgi:hypothetical protein
MLGPTAGPQGSQTGPQGAPIGIAAGAARPPHGERNSMNDGRRQPLPPPKQLLQPGAAARADRAIARHINRDMTKFSRQGRGEDLFAAGERRACVAASGSPPPEP